MAKLKKDGISFTQVANEVINDPTLSFRAKGIYAYLFSKPDGWDFETRRIANDSKDGRDATRNGIKELEDRGYLKRTKLSSRRMEYQLKHSLKPMTENPSLSMTEKANDGKSHSGKSRHISNTDSESNKEIKEISTKVLGAKAPDTRISELVNFLKEKIGGSLDGTQQDNRRYCYLLLNRFAKDYPAREPVELVKGLIMGAVSDSFHAKNTASFKYLYYNAAKIILSITKAKSNKIIGL